MELNKIYNEDCYEGLDKLPDDSIDLIITDPPYFLPITSYVGVRGKGYNKRTLADASIITGYFKTIFEKLDRILKTDGTYYVFCDAQSYPSIYHAMFPYCKHVRLLIWDKIVSYNGYTWRHQHELIAWGEKEESERVKTGDGDIIKCRGVLQKNRSHPAEKPVEVLVKLIDKHWKEDLIVLDPYMGSGSTALACKQLNVNYIGFELDDNHLQTSNERLKSIQKVLV